MRWLLASGLLLLGLLDIAGALLVSPASAAVLVVDPARPDAVLALRALLWVGPGVALALVLALTCALSALGVAARQPWSKALAGVLTALHLPWAPVSLPLLAGLAAWPTPLPEPSAPPETT